MSGLADNPAVRSAAAGFAIALPIVAVALLLAATMNQGGERTVIVFLIGLTSVVGLGIYTGNSGVLSFGHVAFIGLGAYVSGLLTVPVATKAMALPNLPPLLAGAELDIVSALFISLAIGALVAFPIGIVVARMSDAAAVIATLGVLLIFHGIVVGAADFTRGSNAFLGVPRTTSLWGALAVAAATIVAARLFRDSGEGLRLRAAREDQLAARSIGIGVERERIVSWVISAVAATAAGVLLGHFLGAFSPSKFYFDDTLTILTMLIVGGMRTVSGAVAGAVVVTILIEVLRRLEPGVTILGVDFPEAFGLTQAGLCVLILAVMYWRPRGLLGRLEIDEMIYGTGAAVAPETPGLDQFVVEGGGALRVERLTKDFAGLRALDQVSAELRPGEIVGLIGPNGSGKTTLLNAVAGVVAPSAGTIAIDGVDVTQWGARQVAGAGVARTFQGIRLFADLAVHENVEAALVAGRLKMSRRQARDLTASLLAETRLGEHAAKRAGDLAYGLQRRLEITRALAVRPRYLLLDEPAAGMNPSESDALLGDLKWIRERFGVGILLVEHDLRLIMRLCDRLIVLNKGQVIAEGSPSEVQKHPAVMEAYLGRPRN
jgi:branched-chain amino acid transport system ATP-binding protein/branched-chain amino acid transport system permease protein